MTTKHHQKGPLSSGVWELGARHGPFVLLEDRLAEPARARLYKNPVEIVRCDRAKNLAGAFDRLEQGLSRGLHAAGFLAYELGYALEPRLAGLLPDRWDTPLLWLSD